MPTPSRSLALIFGTFVVGCFSPRTEPKGGDDDASTSGDSESGTSEATTSAGNTSPSTTADGTASDASGDSTTEAVDSDTESPGACGDGKIDDGEECDDGQLNGPGQACRADCQLNVCGDSDQGPDEACDDGPGNELELGACAPDCSKVIDAKVIRVSGVAFQVGAFPDGNLGPDPIGTLDQYCPENHKALFSVPGGRRAATSAYEADPVDWVLQPYTAYRRPQDDEIVWITDETPLLGVRAGTPESLENPVFTGNVLVQVISGMHQDWTTAMTSICDGWTSSSGALSVAVGDGSSLDDYLRGHGTTTCSEWNQPLPGGQPNLAVVNVVSYFCIEQ